MIKDTLVFSIALNGYQWRYRNHLASHQRYAKKFNYHYQVITRPYISKLGVECCWMKLTLMHAALVAGYKHVIFLDADAFVQSTCPEIESLMESDKYLYLAKSYSKRFNSGVMIVKNNTRIRHWLMHVINSRHENIRSENKVGWGENGHIIQHSHHCTFIKEIPQAWNNTQDANMNDYIRHQNCGPLRNNVFDRFFHKVIFYCSSKIEKTLNYINTWNLNLEDRDLLNVETRRVLAIYPCFSQTPSALYAKRFTSENITSSTL